MKVSQIIWRRLFIRFGRMIGGLPSGWMRKVLLFLVLITGVLLIAMYAHAPPLVSLQPFAPRRTFNTPWSWICVAGRCERRAVKTSQRSLASCTATCGGHGRLLWPKPTGDIILGEDSVMLNLQQIEFVTISTSDHDVQNLLEHAKDIFIGNIRNLEKAATAKGQSNIDNFVIYLSAGDGKGTKLMLDTDESYKLEVKLNNKYLEGRITANSYHGVRHGLETLSQLFWWDEIAGKQGGLRVLSNVYVIDKPTFHYRGLLIDTGRQFFPIEQLKRVVDGMAASKLNTFHWHLTDSQSFPFDSTIFPNMARWGAYSAEETYSSADIKDLVDYAKIRGIRIIVEIDSPAHAGAGWQWGPEHGLGELALCVDQEPWSSYCGEPNCGQLNPINKHTYKIIEELYKELLDLTDVRDIIHLGGDEVNLDCWAQYSNITQAMQAQNFTDLHALWADFEGKIYRRIVHANRDQTPKAAILWSSPLTKRPWITSQPFDPKVHVIQSWGGSTWPETGDLLEDGFRVILSHVDAWYLDCGFGKWRETGEAACGEYRTWQTVYNHRPWRDYPSSMHLIMGGEAALWSEQIGQASLGPRLWPRASAFAERLWSDPPGSGYTTEETVYTRLAAHIDLLQARGLKTEAMWPQWCTHNPGKCL
ncbi:Similar to fdl: Probable beta-hexosaminidase fdl (Drosophila melanogaster) [Cotesia congregata]|uniref:beta-N-acetylhexosaminidase n=1 Tax=Cotesia congregata TaxID=51543 RepID=A0A8J2HKZ8_COTCN|nr:Similar to fdl: Probable beta-hexosaminidase fdl (Drosophila melanogaster) [Cotesia congregata]